MMGFYLHLFLVVSLFMLPSGFIFIPLFLMVFLSMGEEAILWSLIADIIRVPSPEKFVEFGPYAPLAFFPLLTFTLILYLIYTFLRNDILIYE